MATAFLPKHDVILLWVVLVEFFPPFGLNTVFVIDRFEMLTTYKGFSNFTLWRSFHIYDYLQPLSTA